MSLPAGVLTRPVRLSAPVTHTGDPLTVRVTIEPSHTIVHAATGTALPNIVTDNTADPGTGLVIDLPVTDQAGFIDTAGNSFTGWSYTARIEQVDGTGKSKHLVKKFAVPSDLTDLDLMMVPGGNPAAPVIGATPLVLSVAGLAGVVTAEDLAGAVVPLLPDSATSDDIEAAVAPKLDAEDAATLYAAKSVESNKLGKKDPRGDMFLGFATALKNANESTGLYVIGDSTTTPDTAWFRLLANDIAAANPAFTSRYWKWNDTTQKFDRPIELNNGGAKRAMVMASGGTRSGRAAPGPNITGPIEGIVHMKAPAYVGDYFLLSKWTNDTQVSWAWRMTAGAGGWPQLLISADGTTSTVAISTGPANLVDGQETWLKFNYTPNDGAGNRVTKFWKSTDGVTWTQIGTTQTTAGALVPYQGTSDYMVGARSYTTGAWPAGTEFYESWINDGIDGGPVVPVLPHTWPTSIGATASLTTGAPQLNFVMGAQPGAGIGYDMNTVGYLADPVRLPKMTPDMGQQIAFFNTGHNEGQYGYRYRKQKYMAWVDAVTARMPGVQRIGMTQNPRTGTTAGPSTPGGRGHMADRAFMLSWARSVADLDVLDVWDAFVTDGRPVDGVLVGDGVHPTSEGYLLWKNYVKAELDAALARVTV